MATFQDWNSALLTYTTHGLSIGARVFLSIDDAALETIGQSFAEQRPSYGWVESFKRSVRAQCVYRDEVGMARFTRPLRDNNQRPRYVPFLAAMVLAAHYMGDASGEKPIDPKDFFTHFNTLLNLSDQRGRTKGLDAGRDSDLWEDWGAWLRSQGLIPTARPGTGTNNKNINYPISQTILRQSDRNRLQDHFTKSNWPKNLDEMLLIQRIRNDARYLTKHLQDILAPNSDMWQRSYDAISQACYETYEDWREAGAIEGESSRSGTSARIRTSLDAKLWRQEDFFSGEVEYRVYPRQARQASSGEISVSYGGELFPLSEDRPGWYMPLWELDSEQLSSGWKIPVQAANSALQHMYLANRGFWVLTLDPDTPESGIYASWGRSIDIGAEFILLAQSSLHSDITKLGAAGLVEWGAPKEAFANWYEYRGVTLQSEPDAWSGIRLENEALLLTLQPRIGFSLSFVGGLRAPRGRGWITGYGPHLTVASFLPAENLTVFDEAETPIFSQSVNSGELIAIPWQGAGSYRVVVEQDGHFDERIVRLLDWTEIDSRPLDFERIAVEAGLTFFGAWTERRP